LLKLTLLRNVSDNLLYFYGIITDYPNAATTTVVVSIRCYSKYY